jgi:predicted nuclease with TOPRIM domain
MEKTAREVIKDTIGISVGAGDITPMDYGECVKCMELYANLHSSQLKEELEALKSKHQYCEGDYRSQTDEVKRLRKIIDAWEPELSALREENERLRKRVNNVEFVLRNCRSYLELYRDEWKEGEQSLYAQLSASIRESAVNPLLNPSHNTEEK